MITLRLSSEAEAAELLRRGKLVAFPTETVFGLGADATNPRSIENVFRAKGRPSDNPLIVHLADVQDWSLAASVLTHSARILLDAFTPGPLTVVLPKGKSIDPLCTAGQDSVAIRIPQCEITRRLLRTAAIPVAAPSANRSGRPSCTTWQSVLEDLDGRIDAVLCSNPKVVGLESTVVDCRGEIPVLLRPGVVTLEDIQHYFPGAYRLPQSQMLAGHSPGIRHPHYRPQADVKLFSAMEELRDMLVREDLPCAACVMASPEASTVLGAARPTSSTVAELGEKRLLLWREFCSLEAYAAEFYEFLRAADRSGAKRIYIQLVAEEGIGQALRDRQLRAAGKA